MVDTEGTMERYTEEGWPQWLDNMIVVGGSGGVCSALEYDR